MATNFRCGEPCAICVANATRAFDRQRARREAGPKARYGPLTSPIDRVRVWPDDDRPSGDGQTAGGSEAGEPVLLAQLRPSLKPKGRLLAVQSGPPQPWTTRGLADAAAANPFALPRL